MAISCLVLRDDTSGLEPHPIFIILQTG